MKQLEDEVKYLRKAQATIDDPNQNDERQMRETTFFGIASDDEENEDGPRTRQASASFQQ